MKEIKRKKRQQKKNATTTSKVCKAILKISLFKYFDKYYLLIVTNKDTCKLKIDEIAAVYLLQAM